jgi:hypothetical protein
VRHRRRPQRRAELGLRGSDPAPRIAVTECRTLSSECPGLAPACCPAGNQHYGYAWLMAKLLKNCCVYVLRNRRVRRRSVRRPRDIASVTVRGLYS